MLGDHYERPTNAEELPTVGVFPRVTVYLPEGADVSTLNNPSAQGEGAYRALVGHTCECTRCGQGDHCPDAVRLNRVWREVRR